jgi:hypothetical protein
VGLAIDAIEIVISLGWRYLLMIWKEKRIYLGTDEANLGTIKSASILETETKSTAAKG